MLFRFDRIDYFIFDIINLKVLKAAQNILDVCIAISFPVNSVS